MRGSFSSSSSVAHLQCMYELSGHTHTHTHRHLMLASDQVERQVSYPGVNRLDIRYEVTDKDASSIHKN